MRAIAVRFAWPANRPRRVLLLALVSAACTACELPGTTRTPPLPPTAPDDAIASIEPITLNGTEQWIQIRGHDPDAPLLLYLAGGPGGSEMAWLRHYHPALEQHFVVVHWDQRGAAKSWAAADWESITPQQYIDDAGVLIDGLLERFGRRRLFLVGNSWGSILGVEVARRWPEKLHAYVGVTQQVNVHETDRLGWTLTLERARAAGEENDVETLLEMGPPPWPAADFRRRSLKLIRLQDRYGGTPVSRTAGGDQISVALRAPEYSWLDRINFFRGMLRGWTTVYPQLAELDFERDVTRLDVPVYLFLSEDDITVPPAPALRWLEALEAPRKTVIRFEDAGHTLMIDARAQVDDALIGRVLPESIESRR